MRWRGRRQSSNIEDQRGIRTASRGGFGRGLPGGFRIPTGRGRHVGVGRGGAFGGIGIIVLFAIIVLSGVDLEQLLGGGSPGYDQPVQGERSPAEQEAADFVAVVLADTEDVWHALFPKIAGEAYDEPTLVLFTDSVRSACGIAGAATGPFYCPGDRKVYLDLGFFDELRRRFGAPGDFARAYVIAHEVGHHVQTQLGISQQVHAMNGRVSRADFNQLSVRLELQADCLAGVWANRAQATKNILEPGDVEEALNAASAIGDDRLQRQAGGAVSPESFTHGTSRQRITWFRRGFEQGAAEACDTFNATNL